MLDNRIPYDKSTVIWSPDGELVQLSYARRASDRGMPAMGLILNENKILLAGKTRIDELVELPAKIRLIDEGLYLLASGLISDSNLLLSQCRLISQRHTLIYGEIIGPEAIANQIGEMMAKNTLTGGLRAFGASLLIAGFETSRNKPKILAVDNGGSYISVKAHAIGQDSDKIIAYFREHYKQDITEEEGKKIILNAINFTIQKQDKKINESELEYLIIKASEDKLFE